MIPKIIHFCWLSNDPFPSNIQKCLDSWKEKLPDYEIKHWDAKNFDINCCEWVQEAFSVKKYAFAADYIRFYALYNYGGIYLDSDVEVLKNFEDLLDQKCFFGFEYTGLPEAAVVGAVQGLEWCKRVLSFYEERKFINEDGSYNQVIAPLVMKKAFEDCEKIILIDNERIQKYNNISIYPYVYFSPKNGFNGMIAIDNNSYSIHHFNSAWLKKSSITIKTKKNIHVFLIRILGKMRYNKLMYRIRSSLKRI